MRFGAGCSSAMNRRRQGRQVAALYLDNWHKGRRRALWISKSEKLIEDAERDLDLLFGGYRSEIAWRCRALPSGNANRAAKGILFTHTPTLRHTRAEPGPAESSRSSTGPACVSTAPSSRRAYAMANAAGR